MFWVNKKCKVKSKIFIGKFDKVKEAKLIDNLSTF